MLAGKILPRVQSDLPVQFTRKDRYCKAEQTSLISSISNVLPALLLLMHHESQLNLERSQRVIEYAGNLGRVRCKPYKLRMHYKAFRNRVCEFEYLHGAYFFIFGRKRLYWCSMIACMLCTL